MRECEIDSDERNLEEFTEKTTICGAKPTPPYLGLTDKQKALYGSDNQLRGIQGAVNDDSEWIFSVPKLPSDQKGTKFQIHMYTHSKNVEANCYLSNEIQETD